MTKPSTVNLEAPHHRVKNRDLPWQLQQPPLWQRLKRKAFNFLRVFFITGTFLFVVIMSFGDGTSAKRSLVNFSIADTWKATVALKQKLFTEKVDAGIKKETPGK